MLNWNKTIASNTELRVEIRANKWCSELIQTSHPDVFRCCRIIQRKPVITTHFCSCSSNGIFDGKKDSWGQKKWRLTNSFRWMDGLHIWMTLLINTETHEPEKQNVSWYRFKWIPTANSRKAREDNNLLLSVTLLVLFSIAILLHWF